MELNSFIDEIFNKGVAYDDYQKLVREEIDGTDPEKLNAKDKELFAFKRLNLQRCSRINKLYSVTDELKTEVEKITVIQYWIVITEKWCGDSAQNLPYIAKAAALNSKIKLKIILRDSHPEIMDNYLTNGTRSIPILVTFDISGNEKFRWGPRPKEVQYLFKQWQSEGIVKPELYEKLHLWYARNRGKNIQEEILQLVKNTNLELV